MTDVRRQKVQDPCVQNSRSRIFSRLELRATFASCSVPFVIYNIVSPPRSPLSGKTWFSWTMSFRCVFVVYSCLWAQVANRVPFVISNIVSPPRSPLSDLIVPVPQVTPVSNVFIQLELHKPLLDISFEPVSARRFSAWSYPVCSMTWSLIIWLIHCWRHDGDTCFC